MQSLASTLRNVGSTMSLAITAPLVGIATAAISSAADFEQSLNVMEQVSGATAEQMAALQEQALQLGADTSFSAGEAAEGMLELAKAGMDAKQTGDAIAGVMSLAAAGGIELAEAAKVTSAALNAFGLEASESTRVADLLAAAANASAADISDLSQGLQQGGFAFDATGQKVEDLVASLAILTNKGLTGSDAGTALKNAMMRLINPTKEAKELMDELGIEVYDAQGKMKPFEEILGEFRQALYETNEVTVTNSNLTGEQAKRMKYLEGQIQKTKTKLADYASGVAGVAQSENDKVVSVDRLNRTLAALQAEYNGLAGAGSTTSTVLKTLTEEERNSALATILLSDGAKAFIPILEDGVESFVEMRDAVTEQGAAADVANARMKGFNGAIEYLKGSIDSFLIGTALPFLDSFGGIVRAAADGITAFGGLSQPVKNAALAFAAVLAAAGPLMLALSYMGTVIAALTSPIGLTVLALAGLAAAFTADAFGVRTFIANLSNYITMVLDAGASSMETIEALGLLPPVLQGAAQWVGQTVDGLANYIASVRDAGFGSIEASESISLFPASLQSAVTWIDATADGLISYTASVIDAGFGSIEAQESISLFPASLQGIVTWIDTTIPKLAALYTWFRAQIPSALATAQAFIQPVITTMVTWMSGALPAALTVAQSWFATAWSAIPGLITAAWSMIQPVFALLSGWLLAVIPTSTSQLQNAWAGAWNSISTTTATVVAGVTAIWNALVALFGPSIENLKASFASMITGFSVMGPQFAALWAAVQPVLDQLKTGVMVLGGIVAGILGGTVIVAINALAAAFRNLPAVVGVAVAQMIAVLNFISSTVANVTALVQAVIDGNWTAAWDAALAVVSGLVTFIQGTVANALLGAGILIQLIGDTIVGILAGLGFDTAAATVQGFIDKIVSLVDWVGKLVKGDISVSLKAPEWVNSLISLFSAGTEAASGALEKAMIASWDALLATFAFPVIVWPAAGWSTWIKFPDITFPGWDTWISFPDIDWPGWSNWIKFPTIPEFPGWSSFWSWLKGDTQSAGGRSYATGQLSALNERGRELVSIPSDQGILPPGSRVYTNGQSNRMLAGAGDGGIVINLNGTVINSDRDIHSLANELGSLLKRKR